MNKQELIKKYNDACFAVISVDEVLEDLQQLDEPETGHAEEAPRYVKNILARLRELPLHDREVWQKAIMGEFEKDFSHAKWREGYEQGKFEGVWVGQQLKDADKIRQELNKPVVQQFVADWYEKNKDDFETSLFQCVYEVFKKRNDNELTKIENWLIDENTKPFQTLVNMHQFGYEVEEEKRYRIKLKSNSKEIDYLVNTERNGLRFYSTIYTQRREHTLKELEGAGFGWVFDCPGIEIEEVE
ncbi:DUF1642 domain-containing protein [Streptococcus oralis]|uniref:DUF1642 domain-containing protein n=1 Tax=Streptococcus oralis TaxID=1303 RepID=A0AAW5WBQ0_STROR|nr:DUF1642 domain-containing protein [Streptococcus oralis]MCY7060167.1 DUF1642 domain-containing protein [Streptococcus oralis]